MAEHDIEDKCGFRITAAQRRNPRVLVIDEGDPAEIVGEIKPTRPSAIAGHEGNIIEVKITEEDYPPLFRKMLKRLRAKRKGRG